MKRVMIVGQPGAGKSWLARALGERTGLPVQHIDLIHWQPGWQERPKTEKLTLIHQAEMRESWIIEGGLSATYKHRLSRADTLIILDFTLWFRAWRVFVRTLKDYGRSRADLPENCPERFSYEFWKWIWDTRHTGRAQNLALIEQAGPDVAVFHLCNRHQVASFVKNLDLPENSGQ